MWKEHSKDEDEGEDEGEDEVEDGSLSRGRRTGVP